MKIDVPSVRRLLKEFDFKTLFREQLGWDNYQARLDIPLDDTTYSLTAIAEKRGFQVYTCPTIPDRPTRLKLDRQLTKAAREHLIIYTAPDRKEQLWEWVRREPDKPAASRDYRFSAGQSGDALIQKLEALAISLEEEEKLTIVDVTGKVKAALDVDKITKRFYDRFKAEHAVFMKFIKGIPVVRASSLPGSNPDLEWYTSLMLNRLMFVYFIQKKGFLDGDVDYLRNRLARMRQQHGRDKFYSFYRYFLLRLFHGGLGQAAGNRKPDLDKLLGKVPFLDGGFFEVHDLEEKYPDIDIPDAAFEKLFAFFDAYRWHLDERPLRSDNEINPDVVGYIFEKYVNQKQMGAYYTKEDITEYISKNTVVPFLFDAAEKKCAIAFKPDSALWRLLRDDLDRYIYPAVRHGVVVQASSLQSEPRPSGSRPLAPSLSQGKGRGEGCGAGFQPAGDDDIIPLPPEIEAGVTDVSKRDGWNKPAPQPFALPTEIWREHVARRQRCLEIREQLRRGEVHQINDLVTLNLDIWQFARDAIINCEGPELLRAFYHTIAGRIPMRSNEKYERGLSVLDPTCGSGAFLFAALRILETLYADCLERMRRFVDEEAARMAAPQDCGAAFQAAPMAGKMPAPQEIMAMCEPPLDLGSCALRRPAAARIVQDALLFFESDRYRLISWSVMPNHVHVIFTPLSGHECSDILHSWKSFTANEVNKLLGRKGPLWERESFDHVVRSPEDLDRFVAYVEHNPVDARLCAQPQDWPFGSCGAGFQPAPVDFVDPRTTPFAPLQSRGELPHLYKEGATNFVTFRLYDAVVVKPLVVQPSRLQTKKAGKMPAPQSRKYADFKAVLAEINEHPNERYFVLKSIIINNLFGVDIMEEAVEICKLRLFLKLVAQVETAEQVEPLPDIDFNIRAGNTLVGYVSLDEVRRSQEGQLGFGADDIKRIEEDALVADGAYKRFRETQVRHGGAVTARDKAELRKRLTKLDAELDRYLAGEYGINCGAGFQPAEEEAGKVPVKKAGRMPAPQESVVQPSRLPSSGAGKMPAPQGCGAGFQPAKGSDKEGTGKTPAPQKSPAFAAWKTSHQPFHWLVEFFGIMRDGGFDVIIGNPPYVEYSKVRQTYQLRGFATESAGNLYAMCSERSLQLLCTTGRFGFIVQAPVISTRRMFVLRERLYAESDYLAISSYDDRPSKLFDGMHHCRLAILLARRNPTTALRAVLTTRYHKWSEIERAQLFQTIAYCPAPLDVCLAYVPKIRSAAELSVLRRLQTLAATVGDLLSSSDTPHRIYYKITGVGHWFTFTTRPPRFWRGNEEGSSTRESYVCFRSRAVRDSVFCLLWSTLHYWFYQLRTNCRDFNPSDLEGIPLADGLAGGFKDAAKLANALIARLEASADVAEATYRVGGTVRFERFVPRSAKSEIDAIDCVFAEPYGLTAGELDFIINYDIKYRMGGSDDGEDGVK